MAGGEKGDGPQLQELVEQSHANGMAVDTIVGDTAYSGKDNIILSNDKAEAITEAEEASRGSFGMLGASKSQYGTRSAGIFL